MLKNGRAAGANQTAYYKKPFSYYSTPLYKKQFIRSPLPDPTEYYFAFFGNIKKTGTDWGLTRCCFHYDRNPSLSVNLRTGAFRCWSCGAKGHSLVDFYCLLHCVDRSTAFQILRDWR